MFSLQVTKKQFSTFWGGFLRRELYGEFVGEMYLSMFRLLAEIEIITFQSVSKLIWSQISHLPTCTADAHYKLQSDDFLFFNQKTVELSRFLPWL